MLEMNDIIYKSRSFSELMDAIKTVLESEDYRREELFQAILKLDKLYNGG